MKIHWYVIHTAPRQEAGIRERLEQEAEEAHVWESYLPLQRKEGKTGTGATVVRTAPLIPGLVFARANKTQLKDWLQRKAPTCYLMPDATSTEGAPMIIGDEEMERFKLFTDHAHGQLTLLHSPYRQFRTNDRVKILSGPFAGYEGFVRSIGRDNKLIFRLGEMAIALSNIMRYDLAVTASGTDKSPMASVARLTDQMVGRLAALGFTDDAPACLRNMLSEVREEGEPADYIQRLRAIDTKEAREAAGRLEGLTPDDDTALRSLARHYYHLNPHTTLTREIPDRCLRPFLTPTSGFEGPDGAPDPLHRIVKHAAFDEHIIPLALDEARYLPETDSTETVRNVYYAHVGLMPAGRKGGALLFANWHTFYPNFLALDDKARQTLLDKLTRYGLTHFAGALTADGEGTAVHFAFIAPRCLYALAQRLPAFPADESEARQAATAFAREGLAICQEIAASIRVKAWRTYLHSVWLRA